MQASALSRTSDDQLLIIPAGSVKSKLEFHDEMIRLLKLEDWYGRNLDAFNDVLFGGCGDVDPSDKIFVWKGHEEAKLALGEEYWNSIIECFEANKRVVLNVTSGKRENNLRLE